MQPGPVDPVTLSFDDNLCRAVEERNYAYLEALLHLCHEADFFPYDNALGLALNNVDNRAINLLIVHGAVLNPSEDTSYMSLVTALGKRTHAYMVERSYEKAFEVVQRLDRLLECTGPFFIRAVTALDKFFLYYRLPVVDADKTFRGFIDALGWCLNSVGIYRTDHPMQLAICPVLALTDMQSRACTNTPHLPPWGVLYQRATELVEKYGVGNYSFIQREYKRLGNDLAKHPGDIPIDCGPKCVKKVVNPFTGLAAADELEDELD